MESNSRKTQILKEIFGYDSFRKGQEEIVDQILNGKDVLAIMPTGAGKSRRSEEIRRFRVEMAYIS